MVSRLCSLTRSFGMTIASLPTRLSSPIVQQPDLSRFFHASAACLARREMVGTVVSDKAMKSVVVAVERMYKHPKYHKMLKARSKFMAHDELDEFKLGDKVRIEEHRPISRRKRWMVLGYADPHREAEAAPAREAALAERAAAKAAAKAALEAVGAPAQGAGASSSAAPA